MVVVELHRPPIGLCWVLLLILLLLLSQFLHVSQGQQGYNNGRLNCNADNNYTKGYKCSNNGAASSTCVSYLTFRSDPPYYDSPPTIGYLLNVEPSHIAAANNITDVDKIPKDTIVIVPVNCSCSGQYHQHNASYVLKSDDETYFSVANNTYQGLTTCQAMIADNIYDDSRNLSVGLDLVVPLRCACPTSNQTASGFKYLLTYLVTWYVDVSAIAQIFGLGDNYQLILEANQLSYDSLIYPFTTLIIPLDSVPTKINLTDVSISSPPASSPFYYSPPPPPPLATSIVLTKHYSSKKWVFIGAAIGAAILVLALAGLYNLFFRPRRSQKVRPMPFSGSDDKKNSESEVYIANSENKSHSISMKRIRYAIQSLTMYRFEELQKATGFFSESNRIEGSYVYKGWFKGNCAAVKIMKGDVSNEINILKQINHNSIIRLSGICVHEDDTYLVYEYAENGSLSEWLQQLNKYEYQSLSSDGVCLGWTQRVQIAYDVAVALNYLHNYSSPPYMHKNLNSSNILLDGNLRAKVANFGLARKSAEDHEEEGSEMMLLTRHVVGTPGYMAPEYIENGLITPKLDVFAFGVVILELLSRREAMAGKNGDDDKKEEDGSFSMLLSASIKLVLEGDNAREKLQGFMDPGLRQQDYPLDLAFSLAQLAYKCVAHDLNSRPPISEIYMTLSKILSSSMDWDPSGELQRSGSVLSNGR